MASIPTRISDIPVDQPNPPTNAPCIPCLQDQLRSWDMDSPFLLTACIHAHDQAHLLSHSIPLGCAHMQFEVSALVHYANGFWVHHGPEEPREIRSAVAAKLKVLIQDFIRAVLTHRGEWQVNDSERTIETLLTYSRAYQDARRQLPSEYVRIYTRPPVITGQPGELFAQSFRYPVIRQRQSLRTTRWLQRKQAAFIEDIAVILDDFDEVGSGEEGQFEANSTIWRRQSPIITRDLSRG